MRGQCDSRKTRPLEFQQQIVDFPLAEYSTWIILQSIINSKMLRKAKYSRVLCWEVVIIHVVRVMYCDVSDYLISN
jgi:hypothetical protein